MTPAMARPRKDLELDMLDPEAWDAPSRLTHDDLHAQAGADWRRGHHWGPDEMEDDQ